MAKSLKLPSSSLLMQALWVVLIIAAAKFVLTRFGGSVGSTVVSYL